MTLVDDHGPDMDRDDILAAEYVVGVLPAEERWTASARIERDAAFARIVDGWEVYFAPLGSGYAPVEAPAAAKAAIDNRLFASSTASPARDSASSAGLWSSLAFWRGLATAAVAALAIYAGSTLLRQPIQEPAAQPLFASLAAEGSDVRFLAAYHPSTGEVGLSKISGQPGADRVYELWLVEGQNAPVSMGVIPPGPATRLAVSASNRAKIAAGAVLAISVEPPGGSPTGKATGPVVAAGDLKNI